MSVYHYEIVYSHNQQIKDFYVVLDKQECLWIKETQWNFHFLLKLLLISSCKKRWEHIV